MEKTLLHRRSKFAEIKVYETDELYGEKGAFRVLQFASEAVQGAMDINRPERIILEYPRAMLHLLERHISDSSRIFIIGHGTGTLARHLAGKQVTIAEVDELVAEISEAYFGFSGDGDPVRIGDGRLLLEREQPGSLDCIMVDAFSENGTPRHLSSSGFFRLAADKLIPDGLLLFNVFGRGDGDGFVAAIATTLREIFAYVRVFSLPVEHSREMRNMIIAGSRRPITYHARSMAGFVEVEPRKGFIIIDSDDAWRKIGEHM